MTDIAELVARIDRNPRTTKGVVLVTTPEWEAIKAALKVDEFDYEAARRNAER